MHGDLAGENVLWDDRGRVVGVIDWDNVRAAVDPTTYTRARTWARTFGIEQIVAAVLKDDPHDSRMPSLTPPSAGRADDRDVRGTISTSTI